MSDAVVQLSNILPQVLALSKRLVWTLCTHHDSVAILERETNGLVKVFPMILSIYNVSVNNQTLKKSREKGSAFSLV